jgi:hypothetical protein
MAWRDAALMQHLFFDQNGLVFKLYFTIYIYVYIFVPPVGGLSLYLSAAFLQPLPLHYLAICPPQASSRLGYSCWLPFHLTKLKLTFYLSPLSPKASSALSLLRSESEAVYLVTKSPKSYPHVETLSAACGQCRSRLGKQP